jgi:VIT1/CCC1 family predicted Fe2+/Mn2+ transporter
MYQTKFSFGTTSAIITNLSLIVGLDTMAHPKLGIIGGILIIALADNISDSLGIHVYQESECITRREVWISTFTNFLARFLVSLTFILLVTILPINWAVTCAIIWGLTLLGILSYSIARAEEVNPYVAMFEHIAIAVIVIALSHIAGRWAIIHFR